MYKTESLSFHHHLHGVKKELLLKLLCRYLVSYLCVISGPAKREFSSKEKKAGEDEGRQSSEEQSYQHSPLRKPLIRSSASSVMPGRRYVLSSGNPPDRRGRAWRKSVITVFQIVTFSSVRLFPFFSGLSELEALSCHTLSERYF